MKTIFGLILLFSQSLSAQNIFRCRILNEDSHQPLAGVTATISELRKNSVSDSSGNITLSDIPNGKYEILFSSVGFKNVVRSFLFPVKAASMLNIALEPAFVTLRM